MSTSDKLTYLNTTKSKIKDAINLAGASLTNEPFRQYSSKLYDRYLDILKNGTSALYASMPKVTGTGTELSLQNTAELPMVLELGASESTQETTNDLNLFDSATIHSNSSVGSTGADYYDENSFATDYIDISQHNILICTGRSNSNNALWGALYDENKNFLEQVNYSSSANFNNKITINNSNAKYIRIGILKTYLANLFIGYYASPNPDYPQTINVVTGSNSVKIRSKNLYNSNNVITTGTYNQNIDLILSSEFFELGQKYYFYAKGQPWVTIYIYDGNDTLLRTLGNNASSRKIEFIPQNNEKKFKFEFYAGNNTDISSYDFTNIYISKEDEYVAHQEQNLTLSLGSLELAGIGDYKDKIFNNVPSNPLYDSSLVEGGWYKYKVIGKTILTGSENFSKSSSYSGAYYRTATNFGSERGLMWLCSHLTIVSNPADLTVGKGYNNGNLIFWFGSETEYPTIEAFKAKLTELYNANTPIIVYIQLSTPTTEQITDATLVSQLEAMKNAISYDDETNISQTNANRPFIISASAIKNSME